MAKYKRTKLTDKEKKIIIADYIECGNYSEVARKYKISVTAVKKIVQADEESLIKFKQKKEENTKSTLEYMEEQHEVKKRLLDKLLKGMEIKAEEIDMFTNIKDLATAYGIILDKELKVLELQKGNVNKQELSKVEELLTKIEEEANR